MENSTIYKKEIAKYKPLTQLEEKYIGRRSLQGDVPARTVLVNHNLARVRYIVSLYPIPRVHPDDLVQEGNLGLIDSLAKFDPEKGTIRGYCSWKIRANINTALRKDYKRADIIAENGNAKRLSQPVARINGEIVTLEETVVDEDTETTESYMFRHDLRRIIADNLTRREEDVIIKYFYENQTLEAIGAKYGLTRERIRQIKGKALKKLKRTLQKEGLSYSECMGEL